MTREAKRRAELRPHGITNVPCRTCEFFKTCGGIQTDRPLLDCFHETCCKKNDCDRLCPNTDNFLPLLREVNGDLNVDSLGPFPQATIALPRYIPVIDHGYRRKQPLDWPFVAIDTYEIFKNKKGKYEAIAETPEGLREAFKLSPATRIVLRGVASDPPLEEYWEFHRTARPAEQLAKLGISLAVGPNFSMFLNVPRTDNLFNRKRHLMCLSELAAAGISVAPHLGANTPADWQFWGAYLKKHLSIFYVAMEFETGNRTPKEGRKAIHDLANLQQSLGRELHPLLIAATQFADLAARNFERFTLIDSNPFLKTMFRRGFDPAAVGSRWVKSSTPNGMPLDDLLLENISRYSRFVEDRVLLPKPDYAAGVVLPSA
jgi:hypothetical protein